MRFLRSKKRILVVPLLLAFVVAIGTATVALAVCGPFTDVPTGICPFVLSLYFLGITAGTTSTTYSPANNVTRGQMAIFMGALYNQVKRQENSYRVATGMNLQAFNFNYGDQFQSANTNFPLGFATDGVYDYVANVFDNKIDAWGIGNGHPYIGAYTTTNNNGPMVCDGNYIFATNYLGTTVNRIQLRSAAITDPWVSTLNGAPNDMIIAEDKLVLPHPAGVDIVGINSGAVDASNLFGVGLAAAYVGDGTIWVSAGDTSVKHFDLSGNFLQSVPLDAAVSGNQMAYDGQNLWIPLTDGSVDIVGTRGAQLGLIVDRVFPGGTITYGIVSTGQWIIMAVNGDFGCGSNTTLFEAWDIPTHGFHNSVGQCGSGVTQHMGFDGHHVWGLGSGNNLIYVE